MRSMRKVGDKITWNTKDGKKSGEIVSVQVKYVVLVEPERDRHIVLSEDSIEEDKGRNTDHVIV